MSQEAEAIDPGLELISIGVLSIGIAPLLVHAILLATQNLYYGRAMARTG